MIVRLTLRQFAFAEYAASKLDLDLYRPWLDDAQRAAKTRMDIRLPYVGWLCLANFGFDLVYTDRGFRRTVPESYVRGLQAINYALALHGGSPAFKSAAAFGIQATVYPAWFRHDGILWPAPLDEAEFCLLWPQTERDPARGVWTTWSPRLGQSPGLDELDVLIESNHLPFLRTGHQAGPLSPELPALGDEPRSGNARSTSRP